MAWRSPAWDRTSGTSNNDGLPDIWHTAVEHQTFPLYLNRGKGRFVDVTAPSGLSRAPRTCPDGATAFSISTTTAGKTCSWLRSNVMDNIESGSQTGRYPEPNSVFRNLGNGKFEDVSGLGRTRLSSWRRLTAGRPSAIWTTTAASTSWCPCWAGRSSCFTTSRIGTTTGFCCSWWAPGATAWGSARKSASPPRTAIRSGTRSTTAVGYASSSDSRVHFGLGANRRIRRNRDPLAQRHPPGDPQPRGGPHHDRRGTKTLASPPGLLFRRRH